MNHSQELRDSRAPHVQSCVSFPSIAAETNAARAHAEHALTALNERGVTRAPDSGDGFPGAYDYAGVTPTQVRRAFGSGTCPRRYSRFHPAIGRVLSAHALAGISSTWRRMSPPQLRRTTMPGMRAARLPRRERGTRNAAALENLKKHFIIVRE